MKTCCFFGHRKLINDFLIRRRLLIVVEKLINDGYYRFMIGTHGEFDSLALSVCRELRKKYEIKIVVVFTSLSKLNRAKFTNVSCVDLYDDCETVFFETEECYFKQHIIVANQKIINESNFVICYIDVSKNKSGAKIAVDYALKKEVNIFNLFQKEDYLISCNS